MATGVTSSPGGVGAVSTNGRNPTLTYGRGVTFLAALLTLGAAAIHFSVAPDHLQEYPPFGVFFILMGLLQTGFAIATVVRPRRGVFGGAIAVAIGNIGLWTISRTIGLPFGPSEKDISLQGTNPLTDLLEILTSSGVAGVDTSLLELASIGLFAIALLRGPKTRARRSRWWLAGAIPGSLPIALLTLIGVGSGLNSLPYAINMSTAAETRATLKMGDLVAPPGPQPLKQFTLYALIAPVDGTDAWTYNATVPGPELRVHQGDRVRVTLVNDLPALTSIHWHGYPIPNAEDGVAGLTQDGVKPHQTYTYEFVASIPGTYWYHSHQETERQVPRGLYGAFVVEPAVPEPYDVDQTVILGDSNDPNATMHVDAAPGQLVRLRIISAYGEDLTGDPEVLTLIGAPYRVVSIDGHDLNGPQMLGPERIPIDTGQRYDLAFTMPAGGQVRLVDSRAQTGSRTIRREWVDLGSGPVPPTPLGKLPTFDITSYGLPAPDPVADATRFDVSQDLAISAMVGFRYGSYQFLHMFNGKTFPDSGQIVVREGDLVRLRLINDTDEYHPIHLHGHVMSVVSKSGDRIRGSPVHLDSILVGPHEVWVVAFLANNPGLWMLHCHVLIHAAYGLSTMVSYAGVWTPYTIGTQSGNFPE